MINLPNECYCSDLKAHPKDWSKRGADLKKEWYIYYRFHDARFKGKYPKGKLIIVKGMNEYKTFEKRRHATRIILDDELDKLKNKGYNPISYTFAILEDTNHISSHMPTLLEYFNNDFKDLSIDRTITFTLQQLDSNRNVIRQENIEIKERIRQDSDSSVRLFTYYIPAFANTLDIISSILNQLEKQAKEVEGCVVIGSFSGDVQIGEHRSIYSNRIYFYTENILKPNEIERLDSFCKANGLFVTVRSRDYLKRKMEIEKPVAFISYDSRDKALIASQLANGLNSRLCFVWYDEYSLKIGDSLRASIEEGIKNAKKCILILTKNYLNNPGWSKKEFNSIFTREMIYNERIVLPIWFGVTKEEVYEYSPSLADTFALMWPSLDNKTEEEYKQEVEQLISKIHTALTS